MAVDKKDEKKGRDQSGVIGLHASEAEKTNDQSPTPLKNTKTPVGKKGEKKKKSTKQNKTKQNTNPKKSVEVLMIHDDLQCVCVCVCVCVFMYNSCMYEK